MPDTDSSQSSLQTPRNKFLFMGVILAIVIMIWLAGQNHFVREENSAHEAVAALSYGQPGMKGVVRPQGLSKDELPAPTNLAPPVK